MDKQQNELVKSYVRAREQTVEDNDYGNYTPYETTPYVFKMGKLNTSSAKHAVTIPIPTKSNFTVFNTDGTWKYSEI